MKKIIKKFAVLLIALILLLALFVVAWVFLIFPSFVAPKDEVAEVEPGSVQIAEDSKKIDFNETNGILYMLTTRSSFLLGHLPLRIKLLPCSILLMLKLMSRWLISMCTDWFLKRP